MVRLTSTALSTSRSPTGGRRTRISHKQCDRHLYNPYGEPVSGIFHGADF
ncbi:hypothetical protein [Sphaerospermopsis sp. LEGE 08334]|nr:hypothetical protein [Sphaerospermopsis sp. LEGE 08334]MBE9057749.1 hypothetical protein [Sphaerospermopsis sp. LEGE 08334]